MTSFIGGEFAGSSGGDTPGGPAGGDLDGYYPNPGVIAIQGNPIESGTLTSAQDGYVLTWEGTQWQPQPITSGSVTLMGDVTGSASSNKVVNISGSSGIITVDAVITGSIVGSMPLSYGISNIIMASDANLTLSATQYVNSILRITSTPSLTATRNIVLPAQSGAKYDVFNNTTGTQSLQFIASTGLGVTVPHNMKASIYFDGTNYVAAGIIVGGDLSATNNTSQIVTGIDGYAVSLSSVTTGNQLIWNGSDWVNSSLNLAGGANYVFGALPSANQAAQTMGGDVTGTTAANTVVNLTGSGGVVTIQTGTSAITGSPPVSDIAPVNLTITGHAPYASAVTHTSPGNLVLATAAPLVGGTIGTTSIVNDGYTQMQLGYASTDYVALGQLPAQSGYARFPYSASQESLLAVRNAANNADIPVITLSNSSFSAGDITFGNSATSHVQLQSTGAYLQLASTTATLGSIALMAPTNTASFQFTPTAQATGMPVTINAGVSTTAGTTGGALTLAGAIGTGGASLSPIGGAVNINGAPGVVATSGTIAGSAGGAVAITSGAGAAGFGSNQNGGAGGNLTLGTGAGGAATGAGTAGASGSIISKLGGVTAMTLSAGQLVLDNAGSTFSIVGQSHSTGTALVITPGGTGTAGNTGGPLLLNGSIGTGGASLSSPGGGISVTAGAGVVATSGTVAGSAGGTVAITSGAGAAGFGGTSNGGAAGNITITTGTPGAPVSSGTTGAIGTVSIVNDGYTQMQLGYASTDFLSFGQLPSLQTGINFPNYSSSTNLISYRNATNNADLSMLQVNNATFAAGTITLGNTSNNTSLQSTTGYLYLSGNYLKTTMTGLQPNATSFNIIPVLQTTATPLTIGSGPGSGTANTSSAGGTLALASGAASVASSGTAAGAAGGNVNVTSGAGAAGLGSNQNGGNGGNILLNTGAAGAATGSGTIGSNGTIILQAGASAGTIIVSGQSGSVGTPVTIQSGASFSSGSTGATLTLIAGTTDGGAASPIGGTVNISATAAQAATSGTVAGSVGGAITQTTGAGAAGFGSNQNGGNGGNLTLGTGAGGAATGSGTAGIGGSIINKVGGTTVISHGVAGVGLLWAASSVSTTGGTTTLSAAQYLTPIIQLSGTLASAATIVFPNTAGMWFVDVGALVGLSGANTLTFQSGSATTTAVTSLVTNSNIFMISTYGSNTISINI